VRRQFDRRILPNIAVSDDASALADTRGIADARTGRWQPRAKPIHLDI
jgi:hypothetical protein